MTNFSLKAQSSKARRGILHTRSGDVQTPVFMPVATRSAIKGAVSFQELEDLGADICLGNTYHLFLKPGDDLIAKMGGLHDFMNWDKPILTDSGGFQVFSIKQKKITDDGVYFNSHIDGKRFYLDAEKSIDIQHNLEADIIMAFDECPPSRLEEKEEHKAIKAEMGEKAFAKKQERKLYFKVRKAVERTTAWAERSLRAHWSKYSQDLVPTQRPQIFGIIQGGCFPDLRKRSLKEITNLPFDGFAMGGLAVGEPPAAMYKVLEEIVPDMPKEKPRYLMGVGTPTDLIEAVGRGIDMFDCVLPARNARHGLAYTWEGPVRITNETWALSKDPISKTCGCPVCQGGFSRSYLRHLMLVGEDLGKRYLTIHNLHFYQELMQTMREKIEAGEFEDWKEEVLGSWNKNLGI